MIDDITLPQGTSFKIDEAEHIRRCRDTNSEMLKRAQHPQMLIAQYRGRVEKCTIHNYNKEPRTHVIVRENGTSTKKIDCTQLMPFQTDDILKVWYIGGEKKPLTHYQGLIYLPGDRTESVPMVHGEYAPRQVWMPQELQLIKNPLVLEKIRRGSEEVLAQFVNTETIDQERLHKWATPWLG